MALWGTVCYGIVGTLVTAQFAKDQAFGGAQS